MRQGKNCIGKNLIVRVTDLVRHMIGPYISEGDTVVDATCGNGHDTVMLYDLVKNSGKVYAFDIQEEALKKSQELLGEDCNCVQWILDSHENLDKYITNKKVSAIIFNLGYLPGGDKSIVTKAESSIKAIEKAISLISLGGVVTVTAYPGHEEGRKERDLLRCFVESLPSQTFHAVQISMINQGGAAVLPPEIMLITRKKNP